MPHETKDLAKTLQILREKYLERLPQRFSELEGLRDAAFQILEELRRSFANVEHHFGDQRFSITFSGGIATVPPFKDPTALLRAADEALYRAKRTGKNRIVTATPS